MSIFASAHQKCKEARPVYKNVLGLSLLGIEGIPALIMKVGYTAQSASEMFDAYNTNRIPELMGSKLGSRVIKKAISKPILTHISTLVEASVPKVESRPKTANNIEAGRVADLTKFKTRYDRMVIILHNADKAGQEYIEIIALALFRLGSNAIVAFE